MLDFLIEKGVLEKIMGKCAEPQYQLTFTVKGCLLHLYPALNQAKIS
jgi:hypothetical protein